MEKITVTLKQHTPLIHFQHEQDGATLRASEVKPKLDKYIIEQIFHNNFDECKTFMIGYSDDKEENLRRKFNSGYQALNYRLKVVAESLVEDITLATSYDYRSNKWKTLTNEQKELPFLLTNMGGKEREEDLLNLVQHEIVKLQITTISSSLCTHIQSVIAKFFAQTNFGQRSSKGFGSFTVSKINDTSIAWNFKDYYPIGTSLMKFEIDKTNSFDKVETLFSVLDFYWKCLKSGVNYTRRIAGKNNITIAYQERYIKAYLWEYLNSLSAAKTWEKRAIKQRFHLETAYPTRTFEDNTHPAVFGRALLGCPVKFEYRIPQWPKPDSIYLRNGRYIEKKEEKTVSISYLSENIERIPSPIIFKPRFDGDIVSVYVLIDNTILNALQEKGSIEFQFECDKIPLDLSANVNAINYQELIQGFHKYFWNNPVVEKSIFGLSNTDPKKRSFTMIPRDFKWNNILGNNVVSFFQIK